MRLKPAVGATRPSTVSARVTRGWARCRSNAAASKARALSAGTGPVPGAAATMVRAAASVFSFSTARSRSVRTVWLLSRSEANQRASESASPAATRVENPAGTRSAAVALPVATACRAWSGVTEVSAWTVRIGPAVPEVGQQPVHRPSPVGVIDHEARPAAAAAAPVAHELAHDGGEDHRHHQQPDQARTVAQRAAQAQDDHRTDHRSVHARPPRRRRTRKTASPRASVPRAKAASIRAGRGAAVRLRSWVITSLRPRFSQ